MGIAATRAERLRAVTHDLFTIVAGAAVLLVWAGMVEAFVSQYHQPVIPYGLKIAFGVCERPRSRAIWDGRDANERRAAVHSDHRNP